jgi:hypothetical protein
MINVNHPQVAAQIEKWEKLLSQNTEEVVLETNNNLSHSASPFGCLFTGLFASFQLVVYGINDDAVRSFARFSDLIKAKDSLHPWFQEKLDYLITQYSIQIAEIQGPFEANPNVLARPKFNQILPIELWGASRETPSLTGAKIFIDQKTQLPFLKLLSLTTPVAVFGFSLAAIASGDHISQQLLWTTFQDNPGAIFRATTLPMSIELTTPRFTPSIRLPTQAIIRPRRTVLRQEILAELIDLPEIKRFARWQKLASEHGWPILLNLQIEGKPPLLLHRDSPLALESLFKKDLREQTRWLIIEELVNPPWLVDQEGKHYMAELAIPFARTEHGWSSLKREFL